MISLFENIQKNVFVFREQHWCGGSQISDLSIVNVGS